MTERLLHFTLGPVQSFVEQARRTQDLWAGSFLLSWLSGHAMKAVADAGGEVVFPKVENDALFKAIMNGASSAGPAVGSLPNRFKARVSDGFNPIDCRTVVERAWKGLTDKVWERFVAPVAGKGNGTRDIWTRQIERFWDIAWVLGPEPEDPEDRSDHAWLDRRKNWRTHRPPVEGGDHCMLMGNWQELSGFIRARERSKQNEFWAALKARVDKASGNPLQLDENERLCAMALVKRLFPHVEEQVLGWKPSWDGKRVHWPSTPRLAAVGWLKHASAQATDEARAYVKVAKETKADCREPELEEGNELSTVAGHLLHRSGVEHASDDELGDASRDKLREVYKPLADKAGCEPSAFYALLLMDGDKVGALLRDKGEEAVSEGLGRFAQGVDETVRQYDGNTVYAGGDDVLALLPLEKALPAALELRSAYRNAFEGEEAATISGAIVFAHFHVPLRHVLREAHRLLDEVAKEENGRDSLAVCILTQGGVTREWVSTWGDGEPSPSQELMQSARELDERTSSRFFYAIDARYRDVLITDVLGTNDKERKDNLRRILLAEYLRSGAAEGQSRDAAGEHIDRLLVLAQRHANKVGPQETKAPLVSMDGPLIARFLARQTTWPTTAEAET
jgi:CRISPR-associated protein Cmr2